LVIGGGNLAMKKIQTAGMVFTLLLAAPAFAADNAAIVGSAIGGAVGAAIGHDMNGRNGAIVGAAIGGATGAAIGSNTSRKERVLVQQPQVERVVYIKKPEHHGRHEGWYRHHHAH